MKLTFLHFLLALAPFVLGKVGDACNYDGIKGTCIHTKDCRNSFTITNLCPDDPADVKCCLTKQCEDAAGNGGVCLNNPKTAATSCDGTFVKNRCPGPKDVQCCVFDAPPKTPASRNVAVYFWINAFIPLHFEDVTKPWPKHPGKTMIEGLTTFLPVFGGCFVGDQRGFSSDDKATARMHSRAWVQIGPDMGSKGYKMQQQHFCSPTTKVDCDDGSIKDEGTAGNEGMKFTEVAGGSANRVSLKLKAGAGNPLVPGAPKIDYEGVLTIDRVKKFVEFSGKVDDFPSFEAYAMIDGKGPYKIKQLGPAPGSDPTSLATWNGVDRPFSGRVSF
ncbi:hypothetical protein D0869_04229 [Hortaea werneckii]|uniref:Uncharacterized protein n=1 Tax=Hortaea werneckii TaxID=91943 RepID=A0A3M6ZS17_HORWE|nr:hypothetical protein KC334_g2005 [Hortaea werneckii]KAI7024431.1 hypothetical protein KC355_g1404 [Hortaea werneckii]KAI7197248.1 hypothetical protein KC324_g4265 [Hortaea werneckii]KAI7588838.1 hypothetical protein KC316_g4267 [Hortaea werneckii]KAI7673968.1 hypothetical protein KC318_g1896 [Hortaea werneckii]